jgi:crotonobetainyl-CoA:carnitine CoA-transferase CaiB-like acyl-CoA transferase
LRLPLENIRVLDFGQYIAGPAAAMMLADQGAEVIRIDPPGGPVWDSPAMDTLNRRKRSIVLDLKKENDLHIARELIASADVLIENFRPGVMDRLHLGPQEAHAINQRIVYISLPGFSEQDKERAHLKAWEGIIAAASGQFADMGINRVLMGVNPSFSPLPLASAYAALLAATAISAALYSREASGHGEIIEIPLAAALMEGLVYNSMYIENYPKRYLSIREREIERRRSVGEPLSMSFDEVQEYMDPFYRTYFCKDGRPIYLVASSHVDHSHKALRVMGLFEEIMAAGLPELEDYYLPTSQWPEGVDCALGLYPLSKQWSDFVSERMKEKFLEKTSFEWEGLFGEAGVPASAHRTTREWLNSEHPLAAGLIHEITDPVLGNKRQAGPVAWLGSSAELAATGELAPKPDQHRDEILASLRRKNADNGTTATFTHDRCWLKGVRILDMTNVIAGPTVGSTLVRFGAEVIKLDPVKPTYDPWNTVIMGLQTLRGKRSILADIRTKKGKNIFHRLIQWADVITFNGPHRQLEPLGIDPDSLKAINPKVILLHLDCWGGAKWGPLSNNIGYDDLVQAATGIMTRFGGSLKTPEEHAHLGTIDVLTGFAGAFAVATALYKRRKTGETDIARTSLCACGQLLQVPFIYDFEGREHIDEPSGPQVKGNGPLDRCYEAKDAWFFLSAGKKSVRDLESIEELEGAAGLSGQELEDFLSGQFKTRDAAHWVKKLIQAGMGATRLESLSELREEYASDTDIDIHASGPTYQFTRYEDHPSGHRVDIIAPCAIRPQYAALAIPAPAVKYGKDTREILAELRFCNEEIKVLFEEGVVSETWSEQYIPD